ncbi:MAG: nitroreductase family protein [Spirochaetia bacterium]
MRKLTVFAVLMVFTTGAFAQDIQLKEPPANIGADLYYAIRMRSTARSFVRGLVPISDLSAILWAGNGLKGVDAISGASEAGRTVAYSGDNAYGNLYVLNSTGVYRYEAEGNLLRQVSNKDERALVTRENIETAAFMVLFTVDTTKAPPLLKENLARFHDLAIASASFSAQNIALAAGVFKLASIVMYNIKADAAAAATNLPTAELPLFIMQLGYTE